MMIGSSSSRRTRLMLHCLALPLALATPAASGLAQEPVEQHADNWMNSHGGGESGSQWAVRQLTTDLATRIVGPAATGTKKEIADRVTTEIRRLAGEANNPCAQAAAAQAVDLALVMDRRETMNGAAGMFFGALGGAAGGAGNAEKIVEYFGREMAEQIFRAVREKSVERLRDDIRDFFRDQAPETDQSSDARGGCQVFYRMVWDKAHERYQFIVVGDCGCRATPNGVRLSRWSIQGSGSVIPNLEVGDNGDLVVRFAVGAARATLTASCCDAAGKRFFGRCPNQGEGGDGWVGVVWRAAPAPVGRNGPPIIIPRRNGAATTPPPPAAEPTAQDLMNLSDDAFQDLYDGVLEDADKADARYADAFTKLTELQRRGDATPEEIQAAEQKVAEAEQARNEAERTRSAMIEAMRGRAQASQQQEQEQEQSSLEDSAEARAAMAKAIGQVLVPTARTSGTEVTIPLTGGYPDLARIARDQALHAAFKAERSDRAEQTVSDHAAIEHVDLPPVATPEPGAMQDSMPRLDPPPPMAQSLPQTTEPQPAPIVSGLGDLEGSWALDNGAGGVSRVTIVRSGSAYVLTGLGQQPLLLEQAGSDWYGSGAVLFGQGGHEIRLTFQGGRLLLSAQNGQGGQFQTWLTR